MQTSTEAPRLEEYSINGAPYSMRLEPMKRRIRQVVDLDAVRRRRDPAPTLPLEVRPAHAAVLEALAETLDALWNQAQAAKVLTEQESEGFVVIAASLRVRAVRIRALGR
jgi:hypothetical protein